MAFTNVTADIKLQVIENTIQQTVAGCLNLSPKLVRPAFQSNQPLQPDAKTNWVAFKIDVGSRYNFAKTMMIHGEMHLAEHERVEVTFYFYGPDSFDLAGDLRASLMVDENRKLLNEKNIDLMEISERRYVPQLINHDWVGRTDMTAVMIREIKRLVSTDYILDGEIGIRTDQGDL